jgi:hypothetical protein
MATKHSVLKAHLSEWLACRGERKKRGALGKKLADMLHMHIKSVARSMYRIQMHRTHDTKRGRPKTYGADVHAALCTVWEAMGCPCAENMPSTAIDVYIAYLVEERRWGFGERVTDHVLTMSTGTKKLHIASFRKKRGMGSGRSATVSSPLKGMIPVRKSHTWSELTMGYLQTDSVVHCGDLLTGDVVYSVGTVDFRTYWTEYTAQWNKGQEVTRESLSLLRERYPFSWKEIHPDTGNEFINYHVHTWAQHEHIDMTRSEPYKKNDNMCIEERNGSMVRKHLGYVRLDDVSIVPLTGEILRVACLIHNHFRPVRRMLTKVRVGARWKRTFEKVARTPYERILAEPTYPPTMRTALIDAHEALNPLSLQRELDTLKAQLIQKLERLHTKKNAIR